MQKIIKLREIQHSIELFERELTKLYRLTLSELTVLLLLNNNKAVIASKIASECRLSASNTSKILKSLEDKYLIERKIDKIDRRKMLLSITKEGKSMMTRINYSDVELPSILSDLVK